MEDNRYRFDVFYLNSFLYVEHPALKSTDNKSSIYYLMRFIPRIIYVVFKTVFRKGFYKNFSKLSRFSNQYKDKTLLISLTQNNRNAVRNLLPELYKRNENVVELENVLSYDVAPVLRIFWEALIAFPRTYFGFKKQKPELHHITGAYLIDFFMTPGLVWFVDNILLKDTPKIVVLSNDHVNINRAIEYSCVEKGIKTLYIQHASVGDNYPKPCFTSCIFDGLDSLDKYDTSNTTPLVLGAMRYTELKANRLSENTKHLNSTIGIAVNVIDSEELVRDLCLKIHHILPDYGIIIRAHPNMFRHPYSIDLSYVKYTNACDESILSYFSKIDILISNDSCIHLDAVEYGIKSYMMTLSNEGFTDQYSYTQKGFVEFISSDDDLQKSLSNLPKVVLTDPSIVRFYDESYMKSYERFLPSLIAEFICSGLDLEYMRVNYGLEIDYYKEREFFAIKN